MPQTDIYARNGQAFDPEGNAVVLSTKTSTSENQLPQTGNDEAKNAIVLAMLAFMGALGSLFGFKSKREN